VRSAPSKDLPYDPAPYVEIQQIIAAGGVAAPKIAALILAIGRSVRPVFVAQRFNTHGIPSPSGGPWDWSTVQAERQRAEFNQAIAPPPPRTEPMPPLTEEQRKFIRDGIIETRWGPWSLHPDDDPRGPLTAVQSRRIRKRMGLM